MTRFEKRVAKLRKEYLAKIKERDERLAKEAEKARQEAEKARLTELQAQAKAAKIKDYDKMSIEELEEALKAVEE